MTPEEKIEIIQSGRYDYLDVRKEYWNTPEGQKRIHESMSERPRPFVGELPYKLKIDLGEHPASVQFKKGLANEESITLSVSTASLNIDLKLEKIYAKLLLNILLSKYVICDILTEEHIRNSHMFNSFRPD